MAYSTSTLAQGCFGKVYKQKYKDTWAAIKKVPQHLISRKDLERECEVYNKSNHPNIVKLLDNITLTDGKWVIPLEFVFGEDLETTIFKSAESKIQLTPENRGTIILGMCEGLLHLHSKDIVHQDLKPENIMVEHATNRAVIIDLGLAKFFRYGLNSAMDMGNEAYSPPEVLNRRSQRNQRSDVWAMGKIIAELCARIRLYTPTVGPAKIKETLKDSEYCPVVCRMVNPSPSVRATMAMIIGEIRKIAGKGTVTDATNKNNLLSPPPTERARSASPINRFAGRPINRNLSPMNRFADKNPTPSPLNWERTPRPQLKLQRPAPGPHNTHIRNLSGNANKKQDVKPAGGGSLTEDLVKVSLPPDVVKNLPSDLPANGRVKVESIMEKDGVVGKWIIEVVTRDGKITEFKEIKINSK